MLRHTSHFHYLSAGRTRCEKSAVLDKSSLIERARVRKEKMREGIGEKEREGRCVRGNEQKKREYRPKNKIIELKE